jgi:multidrug efflux pump subunit AcrB
VIALFIMVLGGVAITQLPIAQYPPVAPPSIVVSAYNPPATLVHRPRRWKTACCPSSSAK